MTAATMRMDAGMAGPVEIVRQRLGQKTWVRISDVASACDVSCGTVSHWIEEGEVQGIDIGLRGKPCWKVLADSVVQFYARRAVR